MTLCSDVAEFTAWPFTDTITSPPNIPAAPAGVLQNTPPTSAPELTGATELGTGLASSLGRHRPLELTPPPAWVAVCLSWCSCAFGLGELLIAPLAELAIAMPMNGGWPMWIEPLPCPPAIWRTSARARLIGIE